RVVLVDASPGKTARLESIALASGCDLREVKGTLVELQKRAGELANDGFLKVTVKLETFRPGVADEVREMLPNAVDVQIELPERTDRAGDAQPLTALTPEDLFDRFYRAEYGDPGTPEDLLALFKKLYAEVADAPRSA
ncbi:MAG: exonuclease SbcCD subunit D C-terminal domain-containing protein, partial [Acidobacteria bacterium]|nr:exonuclease SbcCD subunit D C-terminal domain-containing protein [Acidobacteriota bacterium]